MDNGLGEPFYYITTRFSGCRSTTFLFRGLDLARLDSFFSTLHNNVFVIISIIVALTFLKGATSDFPVIFFRLTFKLIFKRFSIIHEHGVFGTLCHFLLLLDLRLMIFFFNIT